MSRLAADLVVTPPANPAGSGFSLEASLAADPGITILFGHSGAGKTTALLALLGAMRPQTGRISLGDRVLFDSSKKIDVAVRERRVGIVFQDALLFPHLDARANVAFGARDRAGNSAADAWLERVGALGHAHRKPAELSGGERQRVALARALAAAPDLLLLDEPFSALDPAAREHLGSLLLELQAGARVPFLHVTHDPAEALRLGGAMLVLEAGRVVAKGTPTALLAPGGLASDRLDATNWLRGTVVADGDDGGRVDLGGTVVLTGRLHRAPGKTVVLALPAEEPIIATDPARGTSARNILAGEIAAIVASADAVDVIVATPALLRVRVTRAAVSDLHLAKGLKIFLLVKATSFRVVG